jgi:hypothetical protein
LAILSNRPIKFHYVSYLYSINYIGGNGEAAGDILPAPGQIPGRVRARRQWEGFPTRDHPPIGIDGEKRTAGSRGREGGARDGGAFLPTCRLMGGRGPDRARSHSRPISEPGPTIYK